MHYDGEYSRSEETVDDTLETGSEQKFSLFDDVDEAETFVDGEEDEEEEGDHQYAEKDVPFGLQPVVDEGPNIGVVNVDSDGTVGGGDSWVVSSDDFYVNEFSECALVEFDLDVDGESVDDDLVGGLPFVDYRYEHGVEGVDKCSEVVVVVA